MMLYTANANTGVSIGGSSYLTPQQQQELMNNIASASTSGTQMGQLGNSQYGSVSGFSTRAINPIMSNTPLQTLSQQNPQQFNAGIYCNSSQTYTISMQRNSGDGSINVSINGYPLATNAIDICDNGYQIQANQQSFKWNVGGGGQLGIAATQEPSGCVCVASECNQTLHPSGEYTSNGIPNI
ncbi:MAG: hypothetical protein QXL94_06460, partial [Candidatus Parvarchaeum sp.]